MGSEQAMRVRITGRVQGVGFRAWTRDEATARGLGGWVRNAADGGVEALLVGPGPAVTAMLEALHRGPPGAEVTAVQSAAAPVGSDSESGAGFRIRR